MGLHPFFSDYCIKSSLELTSLVLKWEPQDLLNLGFEALSSALPLKPYHESAKRLRPIGVRFSALGLSSSHTL